MSNVNTEIWVSQQQLADELSKSLGKSITVQRVHNWVKRGRISYKEVPELRIVLVDKNSVDSKLLKHKGHAHNK